VKRSPGENNRDFKKRADEELSKLMASLAKGEPVASGRDTVSEYLDEWLAAVALNISPRTVSNYLSMMRDHVRPIIGNKRLTRLEPGDVERIYTVMADKGLSGNTRLHVHRALSKAFKDAVRKRKLTHNVCDLVDAPRVAKFAPHEITADEANRLLIEADASRFGVLIRLLTFTGLRLGEALGLRWQDIDLGSEMLHVRQTRKLRSKKKGDTADADLYGTPKTERSKRSVNLAPELVEALREHRRQQQEHYIANGLRPDHDIVFADPTGKAYGHDQVFHDWKLARKRGEVPSARIHDLRHFAATTMIAAGIPITDVSAMLGHSQASTTANIYAHVIPGRGKVAVAEISRRLAEGGS
jgi:integrase